jgi:hypothetical protein
MARVRRHRHAAEIDSKPRAEYQNPGANQGAASPADGLEDAMPDQIETGTDTLAETTNGQAPQQISQPPDNIMLHGYRQLTEAQERQLRELKDTGLQLWNDLHAIDGSSTERRIFDNRELGHAAVKLEEMMLWIEKFFAS